MTRHARGVSMMETVLSIALVGIVLVAAMDTLGGARVAQAQNADLAIAEVLCESMMNEILAQAYEGADEGVGSFGRSLSEAGDLTRAAFDDVDDYNNWTASPPQGKDGKPIEWASGLQRLVRVQCVDASDLRSVTADGVCLKRIRVQVLRNKKVLAQLEAYRSPLWPDPGEVSP